MPHLKVDDAYYERIPTTDYSKFADAINDVGPAPCTFHNCEHQAHCKEKEVECFAFRAWVNNCLLYTSPSPRDVEESRMPSSA